MGKFLTTALILTLLNLPLMAQDFPKVEVFGGYQYLRLGGNNPATNENGWNASVAGNFNKTVGLAGDFSGTYKSFSGITLHTYTFTFGPVISFNHAGKVNPFVHALVGRGEFGVSGAVFGSPASNAFTMMYGGGADVRLTSRYAYRVAQVDWAFYHFSGANLSKNVRISTGIVLRF